MTSSPALTNPDLKPAKFDLLERLWKTTDFDLGKVISSHSKIPIGGSVDDS